MSLWGAEARSDPAARASQAGDLAQPAGAARETPKHPLATESAAAAAQAQPVAERESAFSLRSEGLFVPPPQIDEYRILRALGRGGMGQVFLGHDSLLDRPVAVKFLVTASPTNHARMRFLQEARAIARLQHPNVVAIYRVGIFSGLPYLVSELVTGPSLDHLSPPLPWRRVLGIGIDLARGLSAVHRHGVLHRDLKPAERGRSPGRPRGAPMDGPRPVCGRSWARGRRLLSMR